MMYSQVEYLSILRHGTGFVKVCRAWAGPFSWPADELAWS